MEHVIHNDYRQQPITSDEGCERYRQFLARLEAMIAHQEDTIRHLRATEDSAHLASAHTCSRNARAS
jgi:flagellar biosynthesis chaperone FliJ